VKRDGTSRVVKAPLPARAFIETIAYLDWLAEIDDQVTYLMGHTRWPTLGSIHTPSNNAPLGERLLLAHNGHVGNHAALTQQFGLRREAEVDSEVLLRLAERRLGDDGLNIPAYLGDLAHCRGRLAATVVDTRRPEQVLLIRGNMPLHVCHHPRRAVLAYASEEPILQRALAGEAGWRPVVLPPSTAMVVDVGAVGRSTRFPFGFT
jgi:glutamine phosphoribosylpyrophosphate amidotransferase